MRFIVNLFLLIALLGLSSCRNHAEESGLDPTEHATTSPSPTAAFTPVVGNEAGTSLTATNSEIAHDNKIVAGQRISIAKVGYSFARIDNTMSKRLFDNYYEFQGCKSRRGDWLVDSQKDLDAIIEVEFDENDTAILVASGSRCYLTDDGISVGDDLKEFRKKYDRSNELVVFADTGISRNQKYIKGFSAYAVDRSTGIAFEFAKDRDDSRWYINRIFVFRPDMEFSPRYHCGKIDSEFWIQLPNLDLNSHRILTKDH